MKHSAPLARLFFEPELLKKVKEKFIFLKEKSKILHHVNLLFKIPSVEDSLRDVHRAIADFKDRFIIK